MNIKAGQDKAERQVHREVTSRPDEIKLKTTLDTNEQLDTNELIMTWNKDRKQTKYGHKRQEQMTHITEPWHNFPLPGRRVPCRNSSTGEGGWALWRPLRTDMDRNTGRGPPERNRQTKEAMAELGAQEAMAVQGAQEAMA